MYRRGASLSNGMPNTPISTRNALLSFIYSRMGFLSSEDASSFYFIPQAECNPVGVPEVYRACHGAAVGWLWDGSLYPYSASRPSLAPKYLRLARVGRAAPPHAPAAIPRSARLRLRWRRSCLISYLYPTLVPDFAPNIIDSPESGGPQPPHAEGTHSVSCWLPLPQMRGLQTDIAGRLQLYLCLAVLCDRRSLGPAAPHRLAPTLDGARVSTPGG